MATPIQTTGFRLLRLLHLSIVAGLTIFSVISVLLVEKKMVPVVDQSTDRVLQLAVIGIAIVAVFFGFRIFQRRLLALRHSNAAAAVRLAGYRTACITWWVMVEVPAMIAIVGFILTANYAFFAVAIFLWLILILFTPRKDNIVLLLNLRSEDVVAENF